MIEPESLNALKDRIIASGLLGRSKTYSRLLEFLVQCSLESRTPKEIEIAIEVMGRDAEFDVSKDSLVRVYIHNLRKKLDSYFSQYQHQEGYVIQIPKGQYMLTLAQKEPLERSSSTRDSPRNAIARFDALHWGLALITLLLVAYVLVDSAGIGREEDALDDHELARQHPLWVSILDDSQPIVLVLGDYYIFGEVDPATRGITRLVREFEINSKRDLENIVLLDPDKAGRSLNLDLSYLPTGTAFALKDLFPIIDVKNRLISIRTMREMDTAFLKTHHVIYVGYISGMDKLKTLTFQASRYRIGETEDEIIDRRNGDSYFSGAGIPTPDKRFRDYGFVSTFPTPDGTQVLLIAGTRDEGLMHMAKSLSNTSSLNQIYDSKPHGNDNPVSQEALYEVFGYEGRNFDATLIHSGPLDSQKIWGGELTRANIAD